RLARNIAVVGLPTISRCCLMRSRVRATTALAASLPLALASVEAEAAPQGRLEARAGGGHDAVEVVLNPETPALEVRRCKAADCSGTAGIKRTVPIPIDRSRLDLAHQTLEVLPIGEGRSVIHVRVP